LKQSLTFSSGKELRQWFHENHKSSPGLWIRFRYDESSSGLSPDEANRIALSFGWVDDRIKRINDQTYRKKFIPRRQGSPWTELQKTIVAELMEAQMMEKAGLDAVARAKADGSWDSAASPVTNEMFDAFSSVLRPYEPAFSHFLRLPPALQRNLTLNYLSAKRPETRARRLAAIVEKLNSGYPLNKRSGKRRDRKGSA
jgi:uncharacterized protein YdeI (YjbR/CyaY-like superfamily)